MELAKFLVSKGWAAGPAKHILYSCDGEAARPLSPKQRDTAAIWTKGGETVVHFTQMERSCSHEYFIGDTATAVEEFTAAIGEWNNMEDESGE